MMSTYLLISASGNLWPTYLVLTIIIPWRRCLNQEHNVHFIVSLVWNEKEFYLPLKKIKNKSFIFYVIMVIFFFFFFLNNNGDKWWPCHHCIQHYLVWNHLSISLKSGGSRPLVLLTGLLKCPTIHLINKKIFFLWDRLAHWSLSSVITWKRHLTYTS